MFVSTRLDTWYDRVIGRSFTSVALLQIAGRLAGFDSFLIHFKVDLEACTFDQGLDVLFIRFQGCVTILQGPFVVVQLRPQNGTNVP